MKSGTIIFINGVSSSGKTSLVHTMQNLLPQPFLEAGIDKFIWMLPDRYLDRPHWDDVLGMANKAGATGHELVRGMHRAIAALSQAGCNVIADHVLIEPSWAWDCAELFSALPAYLIGLQCPLDVLEQRERTRKNRTLGQARKQFPVIHKYSVYDLDVNTALLSPEECANRIFHRLNEPPQAFKNMKNAGLTDL